MTFKEYPPWMKAVSLSIATIVSFKVMRLDVDFNQGECQC